jgi:uncharacterized protein (DUF2147 family)
MAIRDAFRRSLAAAILFVLPAVATAGGQAGPAAAAVPAAPVEGTWLTASQTEMTIRACPDGFCGYVSKIVVPDDIRKQYGSQLSEISPAQYLDANNKDPKLRSRPIQGMQILTLRPTPNPRHYEGEIYNPEDGNVYSGSVDVMGADTIKLKGCWLYVLCQEQQWLRVAPPARLKVQGGAAGQ